MSTETIVIIGSINMDLVVQAGHIPAPGETVLGRSFVTIPGGKGANQAVGVARLGGRAVMVGRVGEDAFGQRLLAGLRENGVNTDHVRAVPGVSSGIAMIVVADNGQNAITVASGANFEISPADIDAIEEVLRGAKVCLMQLELPLPTVLHALQACRRLGVEVILDPAPAPAAPPPDAFFDVGILTPNESEAVQLTGLPPGTPPEEIIQALVRRGCRTVVLKRGEHGSHLYTTRASLAVPGFRVDAVDTTAAGDAFTAALAVARARNWSMDLAVRFANAAGALACTKLGAQPSLPTAAEVDALLK